MSTMKNIVKYSLMLLFISALLFTSLPVINTVEAAGGTTYYVAADGTGDGLSESTPMSFVQANGTLLKGGDKMLFRRGDTFYGTFSPVTGSTSSNNRVEFGAYGSGALPIISRAKFADKAWTDAGIIEGKRFYKFDLSQASGVATDSRTANIGFMEDKNGVKYGTHHKTAAECVNEYDFFSDPFGAYCIYVYTDKDPYAALGTLKFNTYGSAFLMPSNIIVHDLHIADSGYGMTRKDKGEGSTQNIHIYNCVIDNIGGIFGYGGDGKTYSARAGNAIEFFDTAANCIVEYNLMRNTYDVAFTCQGRDPGQWRNIEVRYNIITYCTQAFEIWSTATDSGDGVNGVNFKNNLCISNGEGWGTPARGDTINVCDILTYSYDSPIWKMDITGNTFFHAKDYAAVYSIASVSFNEFTSKAIKAEYNHIYHVAADATVGRSQENNLSSRNPNVRVYNVGAKTISDMPFESWRAIANMDNNSDLTVIDPSKFASLDSLAKTTLDYDDLLKAAKDTGLNVEISREADPTGNQSASSTPTSSTPTSSTPTTSTDNTPSQTVSTPEGNTTDVSSDETSSEEVKEVVSYVYVGGENKVQPSKLWLVLTIVGAGVLLVAAEIVVVVITLKKRKAATPVAPETNETDK